MDKIKNDSYSSRVDSLWELEGIRYDPIEADVFMCTIYFSSILQSIIIWIYNIVL